MDVVFKQYGRVLLAGFVGIAVFGILLYGKFNGEIGILNALGAAAQEDDVVVENYMDAEAFATTATRNSPTIIYEQTTSALEVNTPINIKEQFKSYDQDGNLLNIEILSIKSGENELLYTIDDQKQKTYLQDVTSFQFSKTGTYEILVYAKDSTGIATQKVFSIPVNRKRS